MTAPYRAESTAGSRNVVAVLGPTNTGKTHLAIERMLAHRTGVIGLPLRLLAREVYAKIAARVGTAEVALITGEEKIIPENARFKVCTVEAMPATTDAAFLAIDEIQLAGDLERGHIFTDRLLNLRGREETLLLGAATMRGIVERLLPGVNIVTRPRMSVLAYTGSKKITRLPTRSAVVAFSSDEVYAIAELIRRQRGGAAVVLGSLSPRTRNAQVEMFQNGDVDFLVATDAIGMGLNLNVDHIAFAGDRKFDGFQHRRLTSAELGQIAGRAGRYLKDGTFGVTSRVDPFEDPLVEALEQHRFDPVKVIQWRNRDLDYTSLDTLKRSLDRAPGREGLAKAPPADDVTALETMSRDPEIAPRVDRRERVALLWDICQVPDYRKIAPANHAELISRLFSYLVGGGVISDDWFAAQVAYSDRTDGDIDTLANRIAHVRTWTFVANQPKWLRDPVDWQERTRAIEDRLSDALHERLTARFVDRRTSVLMRRLKENSMLEAEITDSGDVLVENQPVGRLDGFRFTPDPNANGPEAKALRSVAQKALAGELESRAEKVATAANPDFVLAADGMLRWRGSAIARIAEGDDALKPRLILLADDTLSAPARDRVQQRLDLWIANQAETLIKPLFDLRASENLTAAARGLAFRLAEGFGVIDRAEIAEEVRGLEQETRASLRALGVRFGAYHLYVPALLKPASASFLSMLWALKNGGLDQPGRDDLARLASSGRTSVPVDPAIPAAMYRVVGYRPSGTRAVRLDILERLADLIRPLLAWRATPESPTPPPGVQLGGGFTVTVAMTSLLGCSGEDFGSVLKSLGYRVERKPKPAEPAPLPATADAPAVVRTSEGAAPSPEVAAPAAPVVEPTSEGSVPTPEVAATAALATADEIASDPAPEPVAPTSEASPIPALETATAEPAPTAEAAAPAAPTEPQFIEIWRPGRSRRPHEHRRPDRRPQRREQPAAPAAAGAPATDQPAASAAAAPSPEGERQHRPHRHRGPRPDRGDRREQGAQPGGQGRPGQGRRPDQRGDRRPERDERRPSSPPRPRPEPRERPIDPNSPFAALAALKARLEGKEAE
jgi:ATP-dependent RNA helicase SUPV3L1/SUV3